MNYQTAMRQLINKPFLTNPIYREQQGRAVRKGGHPDIIKFERALIRDLSKRAIPFFAHNMVRTHDEQDALYKRGVSNSRAGQSPHNYGLAVDCVHSVKAWNLHDLSWNIIGHVGHEVSARLKIPVEWGGNWKNPYDPAHWQLASWRDRIPNE